jgi:hypothetical protein
MRRTFYRRTSLPQRSEKGHRIVAADSLGLHEAPSATPSVNNTTVDADGRSLTKSGRRDLHRAAMEQMNNQGD